MDDEAMQLRKEKGTVLVATRTVVEAGMENLDLLSPEKRAKMIETDKVDGAMYKRAVTAGLKIWRAVSLALRLPTEQWKGAGICGRGGDVAVGSN
jgi:hypothetical protein